MRIGQCHCQKIKLQVKLSRPAPDYQPRKCDCSFCVKHGASYISDARGSFELQLESPDVLKKYRQHEKGLAEFLLCHECGVLYRNSLGQTYGAVNAGIFANGTFGASVDVSPQLLSDEQKTARWQQVWFSDVRFVSEASPQEGLDAVLASLVALRTKPSNYPEPFRSMMAGRSKAQLGDYFKLKNFGVNLTRLAPGAQSALFHRHTKQDEFIYILSGQPTLITEKGEFKMKPGMCAGFAAQGQAHQLINTTQDEVVYLEIGDRTAGDEASYPRDDLEAKLSREGSWIFTNKKGEPYKSN